MDKSEPTIIKNERGEIKQFSKPALKVENPTQNENEQVIYEPKKRRRSSISLRGVFRILKAIGCWIPILLVLLSIVIIITRPAAIWGNITMFFNAGLQLPVNEEVSEEKAEEEINSQLEKVGENLVIINESQLAGLTKNKLSQLKDLKVDIEKENIKFIWTMDKTNEEAPLFGIIEINIGENNQLQVSRVGTNRVSIPTVLNKLLTESVLAISNIQGTDNKNNLLYTILPFDKNIEINSIQLDQDQINLIVNLKAGLF